MCGCEDHREINGLIVDYGLHLDEGNMDAVAAMFAEATLQVVRGEEVLASATGQDEIRSLLGDHASHGGSPRTHHANSNIRIDVAADRQQATARTYITLFQATDELPLQPVACGTYHDEFVRSGGRWRFARRRNEVRLVGDLSHRLRGDGDRRLAELAATAVHPGRKDSHDH